MQKQLNSISVRENICNEFNGKNVVMTGTGPYKRALLKEALTKCGIKSSEHMSKNISLLIYDTLESRPDRRKIVAANSLGIEKRPYSDVFGF